MTGIMTMARHEVLSLRRERMPRLLLAVFIGMVTISGFIGWLGSNTVGQVWRETVRTGLTKAPNPFGAVSPLFFERNTVIYVVLIGSLSAIVLGARSGLRDRKARTMDLLLSRDVAVRELLVGKLMGMAAVLATVLAAALLIAWLSLGIIDGAPLGVAASLRLLAFFLLAFALLLGFAALGLVGGVRSNSETTALLVPIAVWALLTFLLPQVATGANPVSLLNPVPVPPATDAAFVTLHTIFGPLLITEQFKSASGLLLGNPDVIGSLFPAMAAVLVAALSVMTLAVSASRTTLREALRD